MKDFDALDLMHRAGNVLGDLLDSPHVRLMECNCCRSITVTEEMWDVLWALSGELRNAGKYGGIEVDAAIGGDGGDDAK